MWKTFSCDNSKPTKYQYTILWLYKPKWSRFTFWFWFRHMPFATSILSTLSNRYLVDKDRTRVQPARWYQKVHRLCHEKSTRIPGRPAPKQKGKWRARKKTCFEIQRNIRRVSHELKNCSKLPFLAETPQYVSQNAEKLIFLNLFDLVEMSFHFMIRAPIFFSFKTIVFNLSKFYCEKVHQHFVVGVG